MIANVATSQINVEVLYINDGSNDIHLVKDAPIPVGSSLQVLDGGAKIVMQSGDALKVKVTQQVLQMFGYLLLMQSVHRSNNALYWK